MCVAATVAVVSSVTVYETLGELGGGPAWLGPFFFFHALHSVVENTEEMAAEPSPRTGKKKEGGALGLEWGWGLHFGGHRNLSGGA